MSVIQKIQEKYAKLMAIIIAVALLIFVVMLAFENGGSLLRGGASTTVGRVNGESIKYEDFLAIVDRQEKALQNYYGAAGPQLRQQAMDNAWNSEVNRLLLEQEQ